MERELVENKLKIKNYKVPKNSDYGTLVKSLTSVRFKINCIWFLSVGCDTGRLEVSVVSGIWIMEQLPGISY